MGLTSCDIAFGFTRASSCKLYSLSLLPSLKTDIMLGFCQKKFSTRYQTKSESDNPVVERMMHVTKFSFPILLVAKGNRRNMTL